jgi:hypothetical protein
VTYFKGMKHCIYTALALSLSALPAVADVTVRFQESAPKDRFVISSDCAVTAVEMTIDLTGSAGSLIFDVTADGAGVEVFQPVEVQSGVAQVQPVVDGDQRLALAIPAIPVDADVVISADLDDVLPQSALGQIRVADSELDGATISIAFDGVRETAAFSGGNTQVSFAHGCVS